MLGYSIILVGNCAYGARVYLVQLKLLFVWWERFRSLAFENVDFILKWPRLAEICRLFWLLFLKYIFLVVEITMQRPHNLTMSQNFFTQILENVPISGLNINKRFDFYGKSVKNSWPDEIPRFLCSKSQQSSSFPASSQLKITREFREKKN